MPRTADPGLRERLIAAATAEFAAVGYAGATLERIGARAGVTKGGVYFHFAGKEELFFAVIDSWRERRRRAVRPEAPGAGGAAAALRTFVATWLAFHFREPAAGHLLRVLSTELRSRFTARLREDERQEMRWLRASIRELLVLGGRDGTIAVEDPALAAFVLAAAVAGVVEQWHVAPADVEAHCDAEALARLILARFAVGGGPGRDGGDDAFEFRPR